MANNTVKLYEYTLSPKTKEFVKKVHMAIVDVSQRERMYRIHFGNCNKCSNWIKESNLGKYYNGKIFSLVEDDEKYRQVMIDYYENRVQETQKKLQSEKQILKKLKKE